MKTVVLEKPGKLLLTRTQQPGEAPSGSALVRVHRVGVCGTDWHAYRGNQPFFTFPRILGHELGVIVESVNDAAGAFSGGKLQPGDRCSVEPYLNCGFCVACRRGMPNCCMSLNVLGVHSDGGMREKMVVPVAKLHRSTRLTLDQLALVEPLAIGCHAVDRAKPEPGEWVLVIGAGPIGLSVIPFAQAAGAKVIAMDVSDDRLAFCRDKMRVEHTINPAEVDSLAALSDLTCSELPTAVIDATGNRQSMARCYDLAAHGGRIVFVGLFQGELSFNDPNFHRRELAVMASRNARGEDFRRIIQLAEDGKIDTTPWITHRSEVDNLLDVFPEWLKPESKVLKAMIEF
jgi:2-desacetyl-2-hydroxyethyl bacteriochlorophyllide A dehydrogenase